MPTKTELKKLKDSEVTALKGKLLEVRRIGANPIFIAITKSDTIDKALKKADIPTNSEIKVEALKPRTVTWKVVKLTDKVHQFAKIAVTTKISGA